MTDEYKKLYASLTVLGAAIEKVEAHLAKHPFRKDLYIDVTDTFYELHPEGYAYENIDPEHNAVWEKGTSELNLGMNFLGEDKLYIHCHDINLPEGYVTSFDPVFELSSLPSHEKVAYSKHLPELIRLADTIILELGVEAENIAGEIEQALAMAAKKPVREKKTKK